VWSYEFSFISVTKWKTRCFWSFKTENGHLGTTFTFSIKILFSLNLLWTKCIIWKTKNRLCLFYWRYYNSGDNRSTGTIMPPVKDLVSWHDAIPRKRSLCQENAVLLMVQRLCVTAAMPMVFGSTLTLPTFVSFFLEVTRDTPVLTQFK